MISPARKVQAKATLWPARPEENFIYSSKAPGDHQKDGHICTSDLISLNDALLGGMGAVEAPW